MITFSDILAVIGLFVLRIGVPMAVVAGLVYALKRLDRRWQEEAEAQLPAEPPAIRPAEQPVKQPVKQPAVPVSQGQRVRVDVPGVQRPFDPIRRQPGLALKTDGKPCWEVKGCSKAAQEQCSAFANPDQACWQARLEAEGKIPETCPSCEIFQRYPLI